MRLKVSAYFGVVTILLYLHKCSGRLIVTTKTGDVKGFRDIVGNSSVYTYRGIPYAVPPIGELRFKKSKPVEKWNGVYDATKFSPSCVQYITPPFFEWHPRDTQNFHEDCLYLNIWVPINGTERGKKAVMVWIHGGGFNTGSANLDIYNGKYLAVRGDVIVVTFNYRLGAFGFLYSGTEDAPGNMGMKDQVLALRWIKDNIEAFGGDPSQITIFGESVGSMSVSTHLISPMTKGLFKSAIMESGTGYQPLLYPSSELVLGLSLKFAASLGCVNRAKERINISERLSETVSCLRNISASDISIAERKIVGPLMTSFIAQHGDEYLPKHPIDEYKAGNIRNVPILIGDTIDEGSFFLGFLDPKLLKENNPMITKGQAAKYIETVYQQSTEPSFEVIIDYYLKNVSDHNNSLIIKRTYDSIGDWLLYCPGVFLSEIFASHGMSSYNYVLSHRRMTAPFTDWLGVPHFEDVPFVFGTHLTHKSHSSEDLEFSEDVMEIWSSFAKTGKPTYEALGKEWPVYSTEKPVAVELNPRDPKIVNPYKEACHFWKQYF